MNHRLRSSALRACGLTLCIFLFAASSGSAAQAREQVLARGEAFVVVKLTGDVKSLVFRRFQGQETFVVEEQSRGQLIRVKPGRYFLQTVVSVYPGVSLPHPEPPEPSQTVAIREGAVNYIGDWSLVEDKAAEGIYYDHALTFNLNTVKAVIGKYRMPTYALMVSKIGEAPIKSAMP
jgi:hypothetical protein